MRRLRERRAAALVPIDGQTPLPEADLLAPAVEETITALELGEADAAVAQLARATARAIDQARDPAYALRWLGPELLRLLMALQATPMSRKAVRPVGRQPSPLDRLRVVHASGKRRLDGL
jgi:hypothetical protein